jgi:glyoxylase-like metal-dependent hydrolase (beta-lactamase superfamily II)
MSLQIIPFNASINTSYIIKDEGVVMFDAIPFKDPATFVKALETHHIRPEEIRLIVMSHGDFDHVGSAGKLKEMTGAKIAIHENDRRYLEEGIFHWPKGVTPWGKVSRFLFKPMMNRIGGFDSVEADIVLDNQEMPLQDYGVTGKVVYTPGHTSGSVSILLDSGDAFTGCLAHNRAPFVLKPSLPIYAEDIDLLKKSWKTVIDQGAKKIYPGHGNPFPVEKILKYLN